MRIMDRAGFSRRALLAAPTALATPAAAQTGFPDRPIRLLIPWPPGASADVFLRAVADQAGRRLGQPVIPENRPGASGTLGAAALKDARPDGYTIAQFFSGVHRAMLLADRPNYDSIDDFTFIVQLSGSVHGICVHADSPWKTLDELFAAARANPGRLTYGTLGASSVQHMTMLDLAQRAGVEFTHVPYRGGGELTTALLSRQVDMIADASGWAPTVADGRFRLLVVWGSARMPRFPDVPTLRESGFDVVVDSPYGIAGPKGMDPAAVARLHDAFRDALDDPSTRQVMERFNLPRLYMNTADFAASQPDSKAAERAGLARAGLLPSGR
ncbi:tripartite tricarboxylate transporter substrate binding protein [Roseomonas sp. CAU 1739]|uniref:tripartite tricarboxylate transporter substrate binding protein n=1 Tax=Roseomonas sp. CAU 1739 TaxID=3140364 RepID=UPI00325AF145